MYLVRNLAGEHHDAPVKHFARRPALLLPPLHTSDDDYDAATTLPPITPNPPLQSRLWEKRAGSASLLDDDFDEMTDTVASGRGVDSCLGVCGRRRTERHCGREAR